MFEGMLGHGALGAALLGLLVALGAAFLLSPRPQVWVARSGRRFSYFLPRHWLETTPYLSRREGLALGAASVLAASGLLYVFLGLPVGLLGLGLFLLGPQALIVLRQQREQQAMEGQAPQLLDRLLQGMVAGLPLPLLLEAAARDMAPPASRLAQGILRDYRTQSLVLALANASSQAGGRRIRRLLEGLRLLAEEGLLSGQGAVERLSYLREGLARDDRLREELRTELSGLRLVLAFMALALPATVAYAWASSPDMAYVVLNTALGRAALGLAAAVYLGTILWSYTLIRVRY